MWLWGGPKGENKKVKIQFDFETKGWCCLTVWAVSWGMWNLLTVPLHLAAWLDSASTCLITPGPDIGRAGLSSHSQLPKAGGSILIPGPQGAHLPPEAGLGSCVLTSAHLQFHPASLVLEWGHKISLVPQPCTTPPLAFSPLLWFSQMKACMAAALNQEATALGLWL